MLAGLMSRCRIPAACAAASAESTSPRIERTWSCGSGPDINASATYQRNFLVQEQIFEFNGEVIRARFGFENNWVAGFTVDQPLFQADVIIGVGAAGKYRSLERERARGTSQGVVTDVRQAYFAALAQLELARLNERASSGSARRSRDARRSCAGP
jgi:hypothetical protein